MPVIEFSSECPFRRQRWPALVFLILLIGCTPRPQDMDPPPASAPPMNLQAADPQPPSTPAPLQKKASDRKWQHKAHRNRQPELLAAIEPSVLIGKEPAAVEKLLGSPTDISKRDVSLVWTYGSPECAFQVYFYPDIKTSMFHALQYAATRHDGEKVNLGQGCIQRLLIMRK